MAAQAQVDKQEVAARLQADGVRSSGRMVLCEKCHKFSIGSVLLVEPFYLSIYLSVAFNYSTVRHSYRRCSDSVAVVVAAVPGVHYAQLRLQETKPLCTVRGVERVQHSPLSVQLRCRMFLPPLIRRNWGRTVAMNRRC